MAAVSNARTQEQDDGRARSGASCLPGKGLPPVEASIGGAASSVSSSALRSATQMPIILPSRPANLSGRFVGSSRATQRDLSLPGITPDVESRCVSAELCAAKGDRALVALAWREWGRGGSQSRIEQPCSHARSSSVAFRSETWRWTRR
jgi:hypothetical protein